MTNARFEDLERRALGIKRKKYFKISVSILFLIGLALFSFYYMDGMFEKKVLHVKRTNKTKKIEKVLKVKAVKKEVLKEKKKIIKKKEPTYDTIMLSPKVNINTKNKHENAQIEPKKEISISKESKQIQRKKISFKIKEVNNKEAFLERFRAAGDYDSAIGLAKIYFEKKQFDKSIYWSKKASKLSSNASLSWLIYAKSKYALGKKDDAIKALELYLEYFSSNKVEKLLNFYRNKK